MNILDVEGSLVLRRKNEDRQDKSVAGEARVPVLPEKRSSSTRQLSTADLADLLVAAAEDEVEDDEEKSHARCSPDANVEPGVVREYLILVVAWELVKTRTSHSRLVGEIPSTQLVAHTQHIVSLPSRDCCVRLVEVVEVVVSGSWAGLGWLVAQSTVYLLGRLLLTNISPPSTTAPSTQRKVVLHHLRNLFYGPD